jgi:hypothetical protein
MESEKKHGNYSNSSNATPRFSELLEKLTNNKYKSKKFLKKENSIANTCYIHEDNYPYFHYFLAQEDEKKENLLLMFESIRVSRNKAIALGFTLFLFVRSIAWRKGYFAYFFYHTRFITFAFFYTAYYINNKNFEANLLQNNLSRYYEKSRNYKNAENSVSIMITRDNIIKNSQI